MSALRKLIFGETWILPVGVGLLLVVSGALLKPLMGSAWSDYGWAFLLAWVVVLFALAIRRSNT